MPERHELESTFLANLPVAERILSALSRRHALSPDAAEEFAAWVKMRIIENDYAVLAKFRGESSLATYLTVCIAMLFREYRVMEWGRWRPSAAARREGGVAIRLETMVRRDGLPLAQAGQILRTSGETALGDRALGAILAKMPFRAPLRPVEQGAAVAEPSGDSRADDLVEREESAAENEAAQRALYSALDSLAPEDRLIVRMQYMEGLSVADIARALSLPQKPLYRRLERSLSTLRSGLERAGISRESVRALASHPPW